MFHQEEEEDKWQKDQISIIYAILFLLKETWSEIYMKAATL